MQQERRNLSLEAVRSILAEAFGQIAQGYGRQYYMNRDVGFSDSDALPILRIFNEAGQKIVRFFVDWKDSRDQGPDAVHQDLDDVLVGSGKLDLDIARKSVKRMSAGEKCLDALTRIEMYTEDFMRKMEPNATKARSAIQTFDQTVLNPAIESLKREIRSFENMFQRSNLYHQSDLSRKMYYLAMAATLVSLFALLISAVSLGLSAGFAHSPSLGNATRSLLLLI